MLGYNILFVVTNDCFHVGCTLLALLCLECEDETQKSPWGDFTQQNESTLTKYFVIGQLKTDSHGGDSGNNNTIGSETRFPQLEL